MRAARVSLQPRHGSPRSRTVWQRCCSRNNLVVCYISISLTVDCQAQLPPKDNEAPTVLHILVVGDSNVGKSTLIDALCCGKSPLEGDIRSILGPSMYSACGQRHVRMLYWDQYAPMEARVDLILGCFAADSPLSIRGLSGQLACMMIHRQTFAPLDRSHDMSEKKKKKKYSIFLLGANLES